MSSFRRERVKCTSKSGSGTDEVYISTWFAFNHMKFLLDKFQPRATCNTNISNEDESPVNELNENQNDDSDVENGKASISAQVPKEQNIQSNKSLVNKTFFKHITVKKKTSFY